MKRDNSGNIVVEQGDIASPVNLFDSNTIYNYAISPVRNAMRWLKTWFSGLNNPYLTKLIFSAGTGNHFVSGEYTGTCVLENGPIAENSTIDSTILNNPDMALPLWKPMEVQFDYPLSMADYMLLKQYPYGCIAFSSIDNLYQYGYILNISYKPNQGIANFTLLIANI